MKLYNRFIACYNNGSVRFIAYHLSMVLNQACKYKYYKYKNPLMENL